MHDHTTRVIAPREPRAASPGMTRRDVLGLATVALGALIALVVAIPGVAYVLSPLRRKGRDGAFFTLGRLSQPRSVSRALRDPRSVVIAGSNTLASP